MSVPEISLPLKRESAVTSYRRLGTIGMICAPALYFSSFFYSNNFDQPNPNQIFASIFGVLYVCGAVASAIAMRRLRLTGKGIGSAILFAIQIAGLFLAMMCDVLEYAAPNMKQTSLFFVTDAAYPFSHLLMIIVGIAVVRAGVWRDWRRIPAFLCGFALVLFFALGSTIGREIAGDVFIGLVTLGFFSLGFAVRTTKLNIED